MTEAQLHLAKACPVYYRISRLSYLINKARVLQASNLLRERWERGTAFCRRAGTYETALRNYAWELDKQMARAGVGVEA